ncbi:uncharacterized protein si:ch211-67f13.7 isoform X2 [Triplophysa dalaica]|uniref:uncharacterized protein si:ch211-67f13.7 isoform X2 n=1 Tax=Triplophysa dalaica TaxID=1582913 RepID=UPI0024DFB1C9|nr:uncharacterized protein si:ch211-67f13.7 isoform X2 [Triplophysa dalaica]
MKVCVYTRVILNLIIAIMFSPRLSYIVYSLVNETVDHPQTYNQKHSVGLQQGDLFTLARYKVSPKHHPTGPVPDLLWIPGETHSRDQTLPVEDHLPIFNRLPDVSVNCSSDGFVLRVKRAFYGFTATHEELTLGKTCKSNGVLEPHNDLLFIYAFTDCQGEHQSNRPNFRSHHVNVGVECRTERHNVQSDEVRPTWGVPLHKSIRSRLGDFRIQLMDDSWSSPVRSAVHMLGQRVNVQISTRLQNAGVKLFINSCYVTGTQNVHQATKHSIIDNFGCLQESLINPDARFRFSKADNVVQFSFDSFQFIDDSDAKVSLHCEVSVSGEGPSPVQKSCFYNHVKNRWISLSGHDSVCDCCDSVCNHTKTKHLMYEGFGFVSSDHVVFADPVISPFSSTIAPSTLDSTVSAHNNVDAIWFEAKRANESQRSRTHNDFAASVTLSSSEDHLNTQNESRTRTVELTEEVKNVMEVENQGDVEILMATSESFVSFERPEEITKFKHKETRQEVNSMEHAASLGQSEHGGKMNLVKGLKTDLGKGKASMKTSDVVRAMEESSKMDDITLGDGETEDLIWSHVIADEENESTANKEENLGFVSLSEFEEKSEFPIGLDDLMEQGVVRKMDFAKDPEYYYISEDL